MVKGRLRCIGNLQHLKSKFGNGYEMEIKTTTGMVSKVKEAVMEHVACASIYEEYGGHLKFRVVIERGDSAGTLLSTIFSFLEESKEYLGISEYSVCQTTLEQLFLAISRQEEEASSAPTDTSQETDDTQRQAHSL